jgi:hypothetical protein
VGFDSDTPTVFDLQGEFIEEAAIPTAMVNLLAAAPGSRLHRRLEAEGRLLGDGAGDGDTAMNAGSLNFIPKMGREPLLQGYKALLNRLFAPAPYYRRVLAFLGHHRPNPLLPFRSPTRRDVMAMGRIILALGVQETGRLAFWSFLGRLVLHHPQQLPLGITLAASGRHFRILKDQFFAANA